MERRGEKRRGEERRDKSPRLDELGWSVSSGTYFKS